MLTGTWMIIENQQQDIYSKFLTSLLYYIVSWSTKKQTGIALTSTEAKYVALATAFTTFTWPDLRHSYSFKK